MLHDELFKDSAGAYRVDHQLFVVTQVNKVLHDAVVVCQTLSVEVVGVQPPHLSSLDVLKNDRQQESVVDELVQVFEGEPVEVPVLGQGVQALFLEVLTLEKTEEVRRQVLLWALQAAGPFQGWELANIWKHVFELRLLDAEAGDDVLGHHERADLESKLGLVARSKHASS